MNSYMEKLYNKSAEEIVNDLLNKHSGNAAEALTFTNKLLKNTDGLNIPDNVKRNLLKSRDLLTLRNTNESRSKFEALAKIAKAEITENEQLNLFSTRVPQATSEMPDIKSGIIYSMYLPFNDKPLIVPVPNITDFNDPYAVKVRNLIRKEHPHGLIKGKIIDTNESEYFSEEVLDEVKDGKLIGTSYVDDTKDVADIKEMLAFIDHGIHPSLKYEKISLVDDITNPNIAPYAFIIKGIYEYEEPAKNTDLFAIQPYEIYVHHKYGRTTNRKILGEIKKISAGKLKEIINSPINAERLYEFEKKYPETIEELRDIVITANDERKSRFKKWQEENWDRLELEDYDLLTQTKIYRALTKEGYDEDDIEWMFGNKRNSFIAWVKANENILKTIQSKMKELGLDKTELQEEFELKVLVPLFKQKAKSEEVEQVIKDWFVENVRPIIEYKQWQTKNKDILSRIPAVMQKRLDKLDYNYFIGAYNDTVEELYVKGKRDGNSLASELVAWYKKNIKPYEKKESIEELTDSTITEKAIVNNDYLVRNILDKQLHIDPKYMTAVTPLVKRYPYNTKKYNSPEEDPNAKAPESFRIVGFPDDTNLNRVYVRDINGGRRYEMSLDEIREIINTLTSEDTRSATDIAPSAYQSHLSLNPGTNNGYFVEIPEPVILEMLRVVEEEHPTIFKNVVRKYKETKNPSLNKMHNPVLRALCAYTTDPLARKGGPRDGLIRAFSDKNRANGVVYKGWIPYPTETKHIAPRTGRADPYRDLIRNYR